MSNNFFFMINLISFFLTTFFGWNFVSGTVTYKTFTGYTVTNCYNTGTSPVCVTYKTGPIDTQFAGPPINKVVTNKKPVHYNYGQLQK